MPRRQPARRGNPGLQAGGRLDGVKAKALIADEDQPAGRVRNPAPDVRRDRWLPSGIPGTTQGCACGYLGHYTGRCRCTPDQIARYRSRISGPLLDRIDIQIEVPAVPTEHLSSASSGEPSDVIRERVERARAQMIARQGKENAKLGASDIAQNCSLDPAGTTLLKQAIMKFGFSGRGYHRVLKVARTIADLAQTSQIDAAHVAEAIQYRTLDRAPSAR